MSNRSGDEANAIARETAATIERGQIDDVWCPECWWWNHVSLRCACHESPHLRELRREVIAELQVEPGQVYETDMATVEITQLVEREGVSYAYCHSRAGETSVPLHRLQPPHFRLVKFADARRTSA